MADPNWPRLCTRTEAIPGLIGEIPDNDHDALGPGHHQPCVLERISAARPVE
jgi:hypothetical protein